MAEWFVESCFLAAVRLFGKPSDLVCVKIHGLTFSKPTMPGDLIEIVARVARTGGKSLTIYAEVFVNNADAPTIKGYSTFATVDHEGRAYEHGIVLPPEYVHSNKEIAEEAERLYRIR
jgi:acyl-CoA hydrolase